MTDKVFVDSNVVIYGLNATLPQYRIATELLLQRPVISVQVVNETINVQVRKLGRPLAAAQEVAIFLMESCEVISLEPRDVHLAIELTRRYSLSHWDALIVATALHAGCGILYSEDMHHGLWVTPTLQILNPFSG
ncbi:MAG: PIN domain-containing protein [Sulfuricellaceae bacterium]